MWRRRRVILIGLMAALLVVATLAVVGANMVVPALAQTDQGGTPPPPSKTLLARVATILGIDEQKLKDAFAQAQREMQDEALDRFLQKAVEKGKMTQEEANQYKAWWQARPDVPLPGPFMGKGFGKHGFPFSKINRLRHH